MEDLRFLIKPKTSQNFPDSLRYIQEIPGKSRSLHVFMKTSEQVLGQVDYNILVSLNSYQYM